MIQRGQRALSYPDITAAVVLIRVQDQFRNLRPAGGVLLRLIIGLHMDDRAGASVGDLCGILGVDDKPFTGLVIDNLIVCVTFKRHPDRFILCPVVPDNPPSAENPARRNVDRPAQDMRVRLVRVKLLGRILRIVPLMHCTGNNLIRFVLRDKHRVVLQVITAVQAPHCPDLNVFLDLGVEVKRRGSHRAVFIDLVPAHERIVFIGIHGAIFRQACQVMAAEIGVHPGSFAGKLRCAAACEFIRGIIAVISPVLFYLRRGQIHRVTKV